MKKKSRTRINKHKSSIFFICLVLLSLSVFATENEKNHLPQTVADEPKTTTNTMLDVQSFVDNDQDTALIKTLEETNLFNRIRNIIEKNFILDLPIRLHIQHEKESQFLTTKLDQQSKIITLPFSFLHTLYQGLSNKYEHQPEVVNMIFSASIEFFVWSEFAEYLIDEKQLEIAGDFYAAKDNFASIMMLNQNTTYSDYLADASEAYLLINSTQPSTLLHNELKLDQQRYQHIICISIGFDLITQNPDIEKYHLSSFSWDENKIEQCKESYTTIMKNWHSAISDSLRNESVIHHWLNQL